MRWMFLIVATGCTEPTETVDPRQPAVELVIPDVEPAVMEAAATEALLLALRVDLRLLWPAHVETLELATPGCPNFYAGSPDLDNRDIPDALGYAWSDLCTGPASRRYAGWSWWDNHLRVQGDATTPLGASSEGSRSLVADGLVSLDGEVLLEVDGALSDSVLRVDAPEYSSWSHSSRINATVSGSLSDAIAPGGLRADLFARTTGGDADTVELRGNVYLFEHRIAERYDSLTVNLLWAAPDSTPPDGCAEEPAGWIGFRDEDAVWTELIFQPRYQDDVTNNPYDEGAFNRCDGCANVYIRGIPQEFQLCPDLSVMWTALHAPQPSTYTVDMRSLLQE